MLATTRRNLALCFEGRRALLDWDLRKRNRTIPTALDKRLPTRRTHILYPLRIISEHRNEVTLSLISGYGEDSFVEATSAPVFHLQSKQNLPGQTKSRHPGKRPAPKSPESSWAPVSVKEAQATSFGWIFAL